MTFLNKLVDNIGEYSIFLLRKPTNYKLKGVLIARQSGLFVQAYNKRCWRCV